MKIDFLTGQVIKLAVLVKILTFPAVILSVKFLSHCFFPLWRWFVPIQDNKVSLQRLPITRDPPPSKEADKVEF